NDQGAWRHDPDPDVDGRQHESRGGPGVGRAGNRTTKREWASVFQYPERECRGTSLGWQMTTVGVRARPRPTQSRLYFGRYVSKHPEVDVHVNRFVDVVSARPF